MGLNTLRAAIATRRLPSVAEIGAALGAGIGCESSIPELDVVLRDTYAYVAC